MAYFTFCCDGKVRARIFRPTLLLSFGIDNRELGSWFAIYGVVAMASYFFGGPLADRFQARKLMALALILTSLGGFVMYSLPSAGYMKLIYAFWGFTTICLFWAAMIRATRNWGGGDAQGRAFGWLEGGRGAVAAVLGTLVFFLFSTVSARSEPFRLVILATSLGTLVVGILVWVLIPEEPGLIAGSRIRLRWSRVRALLAKPGIWLLSALIVCAYAGYKITDDFSLYAREVLGFSEVGSAGIGTSALWLRALVAVLVGLLGDRISKVPVIMSCFGLSFLAALLTGLGWLDGTIGIPLVLLAFSAVGIYGVRTLYFAILQESGIPSKQTGTAVGLISFVGFSPEIFMSPWMGHLLDVHPGATGHHLVFLLLSAFALAGLLVASMLKLKSF